MSTSFYNFYYFIKISYKYFWYCLFLFCLSSFLSYLNSGTWIWSCWINLAIRCGQEIWTSWNLWNATWTNKLRRNRNKSLKSTRRGKLNMQVHFILFPYIWIDKGRFEIAVDGNKMDSISSVQNASLSCLRSIRDRQVLALCFRAYDFRTGRTWSTIKQHLLFVFFFLFIKLIICRIKICTYLTLDLAY